MLSDILFWVKSVFLSYKDIFRVFESMLRRLFNILQVCPVGQGAVVKVGFFFGKNFAVFAVYIFFPHGSQREYTQSSQRNSSLNSSDYTSSRPVMIRSPVLHSHFNFLIYLSEFVFNHLLPIRIPFALIIFRCDITSGRSIIDNTKIQHPFF